MFKAENIDWRFRKGASKSVGPDDSYYEIEWGDKCCLWTLGIGLQSTQSVICSWERATRNWSQKKVGWEKR